jgi:hypothetical protein
MTRHPKPGGLPKNLAQHASAGSQPIIKSLSPGGAAKDRNRGTAVLGCPRHKAMSHLSYLLRESRRSLRLFILSIEGCVSLSLS